MSNSEIFLQILLFMIGAMLIGGAIITAAYHKPRASQIKDDQDWQFLTRRIHTNMTHSNPK